MNVNISNFSNIKKLNIDLEECKINFIYGISGTGKSSLANALFLDSSEYDTHKTFGSTSITKVEFCDRQEFKIFNNESIEEFVISKSGIGIYDVIYGENSEMLKIKEDVEFILNSPDIKDIRNIIDDQENKLKLLITSLGINITPKGVISQTGIIKKLNVNEDYNLIKTDKNTKEISWITQGSSYIDDVDSECPFCGQNMSKEIVDKIREIINILPNEIEKILESKLLLDSLNIQVEYDRLNESIIRKELIDKINIEFQILKEMMKLKNILTLNIFNDDLLRVNDDFKYSTLLVNRFNERGINIGELSNKLSIGKQRYDVLKLKYNSKLKTSISSHICKINSYINEFGIKYKFRKNDLLYKNEGYTLIHEDSNCDASKYLSTGEKNIIALILFSISYKNDNVIIDDPASSFDEYKRNIILKFLLDIRYKGNENCCTTLILSHDQIFLKFLFRYKSLVNYSRYFGGIYHLENNRGICELYPIEGCDINSITEHIKHRIIDVDNYMQLILNLRLLYEIIGCLTDEYNYLSAILHSSRDKLDRKKLDKMLKEKALDEKTIIKSIEGYTKVTIPIFDETKIYIDLNSLTNFEKLCFLREFLESEREELNNIVHFNYSLNHLLNPYKFNFQSERSYEILNNNIHLLNKISK